MGEPAKLVGVAEVICYFTLSYQYSFLSRRLSGREYCEVRRNTISGCIVYRETTSCLGAFITNISRQAAPTFIKFTLSGSTINPACAYVRPIVFTRWLTPTNDQMTTMQFDDASLEAEPAAVIEISQLPWLAFGIMFLAPIVGRKLRKIRRIHLTK